MTMSNYNFYLLLGVMSNLTFAISDNPADAILAVVFAVAAVTILIKNGDWNMEKSELNFFEKMTLVCALDSLFDYLVSNDKDIDDFITKEEQLVLMEWLEEASHAQKRQHEEWTEEEKEEQVKDYVKFLLNATKGESKHG